MLTQEQLKNSLYYNPETGLFFWNEPKAKRNRKGDLAGTKHVRGYIMIKINYVSYKAHRLAFLYMTGDWPKQVVDHINHNTSDNRWSNLRDVSPSINLSNRKGSVLGSKSSYLGVSLTPSGKYKAQIKQSGRVIYLGLHLTEELAHKAYLLARDSSNILVS